MRTRQTLAFRLLSTGLGFLALALASIAMTLWVTWQLEGGAAAVNEAGRMRMMSYRLALESAGGPSPRLQAGFRSMDGTLDLLDMGDPSRPLFVPWDRASRAEFAEIRREWVALRDAWAAGRHPATADVDALVSHVDRLVSLIEQRLSAWTDLLRGVQLTMVGLAIVVAVLLTYAMHLMVLDPLRRLGQGVRAIRAGLFGARVQVASEDEFGELAEDFNDMAARLESLYGDLEDKVREKTAHLEVERERMAALYDVSAFVSQAESLDELARGFVDKVKRAASADAAIVRWSDDGQRHFLMLAQQGLPPALVEQEQCLPSGRCHCGNPAAAPAGRSIPIRLESSSRGACSRAGFETLVTVPVVLHHRVLGEVDLLFRGPHELTGDDRALVDAMASHLAGGIEGLRASAAEREAAVAGERSLLAQELHDSIAQSLAFLKIQVELLRSARRRGDSAAADHTVAEIDTGVRECYADVRELLLHFRTRTDSGDIEAALRATLRKFEIQTGLAASLDMAGHGVPLPADLQVQVLHVVQEALSNVRKHAGARSVSVKVEQSPQWRFAITDDGAGFDLDDEPDESHVGLRIMRERAQRIGASVSVQSAPGAGTTVELTVPGPAAIEAAPPASSLQGVPS
jgi:two-component system nitrate/nitrite sensor histidine kinase NarX